MNLSDKEKKFIMSFEKNSKKIFLYYIAAGFLLCVGIIGITLSIKLNYQEGVYGAIYFLTLSFFLFVIIRLHRKCHAIIIKMKQHIAALEKL